jgi:hypothetical protein
MKFLFPLPHYHAIYVIVTLSRINFMLIRLEYYFIFIGPFIDTLQRLHEFQTSLLLTKYYNKTNVFAKHHEFWCWLIPPTL